VGAVSGFQERQLPDPGVGGERLVPPPVGLLEQGQLGAGVGAFPADDDPHPGWPAAQVEQVGDLGDVTAVTDPTLGVNRRGPRLRRHAADGGADLVGHREPDRILHAAAPFGVMAGQPVQQPV